MKKFLLVFLSLFVVLLVGCTTNNQGTNIDLQKGEQLFNNQIDDFQYIKDLEKNLSYNISSITDDKSFSSDFSFSVKFDENSQIQGGLSFSGNKVVKSQGLEFSDVEFKVNTKNNEEDSTPFDLSGNISFLYKDNEMYANLHSLDVFMGEGNMVAKMYILLGDLIVDNWVDLEIHSGGIVMLDENSDIKFPYIAGTLKNVLKSEDIQENPNFLGSVVELIDLVGSYIDLGISTDELSLVDYEVSYFELPDGSIQKIFTGSFHGKESSFGLFFIASKKGLEVSLYNILEYNKDISDYEDTEKQFKFSLREDKKSEYLTEFEILNLKQNVVNLKGKIKCVDMTEFSVNFILKPLEFLSGQSISGKLDGSIIKYFGKGDEKIPELTGNIISRSELLASL